MGKVNVVIVDATGNKEQKVGLPDDIKCGIIMVKLVEKIKLPSVGPDGNPISYKFIHKVTGRQLLEAQTLGEAGIKDGDVLRLQPEITAGAVCGNCGSVENDGDSFCSKCGTALTNAQAVPPINNVSPNPAYNANVQNNGYQQPVNYTPYIPIKKPRRKGLVCAILGIITGAISVIMGICIASENFGWSSYTSRESYGGDAYTGMQNAMADAANNIGDLIDIANAAFGTLLIVIGVVIVLSFTMYIIRAPKE